MILNFKNKTLFFTSAKISTYTVCFRSCWLTTEHYECLSPLFLIYLEPFKYQMRAYIYQARDLLAGDETGLSGEFNNCTESRVMLLCCNKNKLTRSTFFFNEEVFNCTINISYDLVWSYALFHCKNNLPCAEVQDKL